MSGRTTWFPKDAAWHRRGRIVELGQEHGPAGPLVADWLSCEARSQNPPRTGKGTVKAGYAAIAHGCFLGSIDQARAIVSTCVDVGVLDDFVEVDERTFTARVSGWHEDVNQPLEATRKAEERAGDTVVQPGTTVDESASCPTASPTRQDTTGENFPASEAGEGKVVMFDRKPVSADRLKLAERILDEFNRQARTGYGAYTGRGRPSEDLKRIIGALADATPPMDFDEAQRVIRTRLAKPFWDGKPHTGVVFGPKVFAGNREAAAKGGGVNGRSLSGREAALAKVEALNRPRGSYRRDGAA